MLQPPSCFFVCFWSEIRKWYTDDDDNNDPYQNMKSRIIQTAAKWEAYRLKANNLTNLQTLPLLIKSFRVRCMLPMPWYCSHSLELWLSEFWGSRPSARCNEDEKTVLSGRVYSQDFPSPEIQGILCTVSFWINTVLKLLNQAYHSFIHFLQ